MTKSLTILILIFAGGVLCAQNTGSRLFDTSFLHEIKIETLEKPFIWDSISRDYVRVNISIDGELVASVGLRLKGSTSIYSPQKPLQIDINRFVKDQEFEGLKKFNLRNNFKDATLQRERLAYEIYRRAGLPSPRTSFAEVYVNNIFRGLYTVTEEIDKTFLQYSFPSNDGSLYKGVFGRYGLDVEVEEGSRDEFDRFKRNLGPNTLSEYVDLDNFLKHIATDIITGDWDSYAFNRHNFYMYFEPESERIYLISWDHNYAFSAPPTDNEFYPKKTFPAHYSLIETPKFGPLYEKTMCTLLTYAIDSTFIVNQIEQNSKLIGQNKNGIVPSDPYALAQYIFKRKNRLLEKVKKLGISCD